MRKVIWSLVLLCSVQSWSAETQTTATSPSTTTTLGKVAPEAAPSNWGGGYVLESRYGKQLFNEGTGSITTYHFLSLSYKFDNGIKASINPFFISSTDYTNGATQMISGDHYLKVSKSKIALNHDWTVDLGLRYYAPTSDASQRISSNGRLRPEVEFDRPLNDRFTFSFYSTLFQYLQNNYVKYDTAKAAAKVNKAIRGKSRLKANAVGDENPVAPIANVRYSWINVVGLDYKINKAWSFTQWVGTWDTRYYGDVANGISGYLEDSFVAWSYFNYAYSKNVSIQFGLEQQRKPQSREADSSFTFMADNETNYYFHLGLSI